MNTQSDSLDTKVDLYGALKKLESSCLKLSIAIGDFSISYDDAIEIIYTFYDLEKLAVNIIDTIPKENENGEITKILGNIAKYKNAIDLYYNAHKDDKNFKEVEKNFHISKLNKLLEETKSIIEAPTENKIDDFLNRRGQFLDEATIWCQYIELYPDEPTLFDDLLKARNQIHKLKDEMVTTRRYDKLKDIIYGQEETKGVIMHTQRTWDHEFEPEEQDTPVSYKMKQLIEAGFVKKKKDRECDDGIYWDRNFVNTTISFVEREKCSPDLIRTLERYENQIREILNSIGTTYDARGRISVVDVSANNKKHIIDITPRELAKCGILYTDLNWTDIRTAERTMQEERMTQKRKEIGEQQRIFNYKRKGTGLTEDESRKLLSRGKITMSMIHSAWEKRKQSGR